MTDWLSKISKRLPGGYKRWPSIRGMSCDANIQFAPNPVPFRGQLNMRDCGKPATRVVFCAGIHIGLCDACFDRMNKDQFITKEQTMEGCHSSRA